MFASILVVGLARNDLFGAVDGLGIVEAGKNQGCFHFLCSEDDSIWKEDECLQFHNATAIYIRGCPAGQACNTSISQGYNNTCYDVAPKWTHAYIGEACSDDIGCIYGDCIRGLCKEALESMPCTDTSYCDPMLRCVDAVCIPLMPVGSINCFDSNDCENSSCLNLDGFSANGTCIPYFSQPLGSNIT